MADRITIEDIENEIVREDFYHFPGTTLTVCALVLRNGMAVTGESACCSMENFDAEYGKNLARANAKEKVWSFLGFRLRDALQNKNDSVYKAS